MNGAMPSVLLVAPYPPKKDGLATYARDLVNALRPLASVHVAAQAPGRSEGEVSRALSASPLSVRRIVRVADDVGPDVVHVQFTIPAYGLQVLWVLLGVGLIRRRHRVSTVWSLHEVNREIDLLGPVARLLFRAIGRLADTIVVHSEDARSRLIGAGVVDDRDVVFLPHGVFDARDGARPGVGAGADDGPVLFFGYLHPDKGIQHLVEAFAAIPEPTRLVIAGSVRPRRGVFTFFERADHRYEADLRARVEALGLAHRVSFAGYLSDDELSALLDRARLVVFPYVDVTQSGAVNRAVAAGCPVVASDLSGLRDDLPSEAALVPVADAGALATTITALLGDDARRAAMSGAALGLADQRSAARTAEALSDVYARSRGARSTR